MDTPIRYRPRLGVPRSGIERCLQWAWRWRTELMLAYLVLAVTALIAYWVR